MSRPVYRRKGYREQESRMTELGRKAMRNELRRGHLANRRCGEVQAMSLSPPQSADVLLETVFQRFEQLHLLLLDIQKDLRRL